MDALPVELIERIAQYSNIATIGCLRLTCRDLAAKALCGEYADSLQQRTVCWNAMDSVDYFTSLVSQSTFGIAARLLQTVTVAGRCMHHHTLDHDTANGDEASAPQRQHALHKVVTTLDLETRDDLRIVLVVHDTRPDSPFTPPNLKRNKHRISPNDYRPTWKCAASTFAFGINALASMSNRVVGLDLFSSYGQECALAIDQLGPCFRYERLASALSQLRTISMRLSHAVASDTEDSGDVDDSDESTISLGNAPSDSKSDEAKPLGSVSNDTNIALDPASYVRDFLGICPLLQSLHIHWYNLTARVDQSDAQTNQIRFFDHLEATKLPYLQRLSLAGIECRGDVLTAFAATHSATLRRISLDEITLYSGEFQPFFNCLQSKMPQLEAYDFDNLYEGRDPICFLVPGKPNTPSTDPSDGPNRLQRDGRQDVQSRFQYRVQEGGSVGCPRLFQSLLSSVRKYGPPMATYSSCYRDSFSPHRTGPTAPYPAVTPLPTAQIPYLSANLVWTYPSTVEEGNQGPIPLDQRQ